MEAAHKNEYSAPVASPAACAVQRLRLRNFRNYEHLALDLSAQVVVLSGANGAGKTNLLEAISFLSPGRGLRRARLRDAVRNDVARNDVTGHDASPVAPSGTPSVAPSVDWAVAATVQGPDGLIKLGSSLARTERGTDRRLARQDGETVSPASLAQVVGVQWLTPQMDRLFLEGPSSRRRFLDRLVLGLDPDHGRRVGAYERSLRERAKLLRMGPGGGADPAWLSALEARMAADGVAVAAARREALSRLQRLLSTTSGEFPKAGLAIEGRIESWLAEQPAVEVESRFAAMLAANRQRDGEANSTCDGPHRSDLTVHHLDKDMPAALCSTGEQKALLIAVMLANARAEADRRGAAPILLLDEVAAHLDRERRVALFGEILALGGQAWLSGTDRELFEPLFGQAQFVSVDRGRARLEDNA
ncbi:MAG: DNA replication/repair protein RecF [Rhodospirillaceae bacterium]|nr:DNA replication/repair protein RecF [Rhodospirillaceae bacterium]MBT4688744.1 DNA replication/repair protein RecF [Rhodospirillaceae bacterium]MBT5083430.1 DNA replication/repair protein RecF [Rhodospirillaceae bacterium]MBT5525520.1 DNA replication/repair protein RecF [Rhodospirillaceae bacterium]MBT5880628.1 DNA replication/repair protein RecF [Rhodospirillaceae bacterium]